MDQSVVLFMAAVVLLVRTWKVGGHSLLRRILTTVGILFVWRIAYVAPTLGLFVIITGVILIVVGAVVSYGGNTGSKARTPYDAWKVPPKGDNDD